MTAPSPPAGTLTLHEADLLQDGAFDEVVRGAHFVFHTASPFFIKAEEDAQKELIDPALKGTQVRFGGLLPLVSLWKRPPAATETCSIDLRHSFCEPFLVSTAGGADKPCWCESRRAPPGKHVVSRRDACDCGYCALQNVLGSVVKSKDTVRRIILTSSVAGAHHGSLRPLSSLTVLMTALLNPAAYYGLPAA